jgi:hypothetical protein
VPRWYRDSGKLSLEQVADSFVDMLSFGIATQRR